MNMFLFTFKIDKNEIESRQIFCKINPTGLHMCIVSISKVLWKKIV